jgi:ABC-type nitrate/sulfonate/bicarbonate transport system permease component
MTGKTFNEADHPSRMRQRLKAFLPAIALLAFLIIVWQLLAASGAIKNDVLPSPSRIASAGWDDRTSLAQSLAPTLREVFAGFALSLTLAFALSIVIDRFKPVGRALTPALIVSQTLPIIVIAPLTVIWFGFGLLPKVLLVALVTFFPIVISLVEGYRSTAAESMTLLATMGAGWWTTFTRLRLPSALPGFFTGLRIAITYAVVAAIFAEYAGAENGLGIYMQSAKNSFRTDLVLAAVAICSLLTLILYAATFAIERMVIPWYGGERR